MCVRVCDGTQQDRGKENVHSCAKAVSFGPLDQACCHWCVWVDLFRFVITNDKWRPNHTHSIYRGSEAPSSLMAPLDRLSSSALFIPTLLSLLPLLFPSLAPPPPLFFSSAPQDVREEAAPPNTGKHQWDAAPCAVFGMLEICSAHNSCKCDWKSLTVASLGEQSNTLLQKYVIQLQLLVESFGITILFTSDQIFIFVALHVFSCKFVCQVWNCNKYWQKGTYMY